MSFVLAVEPDASQARVLRQIVTRRIDAELVVVATTEAAIKAIDRRTPDLILVSVLLSPRDEDGLFSHLRTLSDAAHIQTLTIPQLQRRAPAAKKSSGFSFRKKKKVEAAPAGCDPDVFAEEVSAYLARAIELHSQTTHAAPAARLPEPPHQTAASAPAADEAAPPEPEWRDTAPEPPDAIVDGRVAVPFAPSAEMDPTDALFAAQPLRSEEAPPAAGEHPLTVDEAVRQGWIDVGLDELVHHLGLEPGAPQADARSAETPAAPATEPTGHPGVSAEAQLAAELERARQEAERIRELELARALEEADRVRATAIAQAQQEAELVRQRELARAQAEADRVREAELARAQEAADRLRQAELARAQQEADRLRQVELARAEAEAQARLAAEVERVQRAAEERQQAELSRLQAEAEAERLRAVMAARAEAEAEARRALAAEMQQLRQEEVSRVRAEVEGRLSAELENARAEADRLREAELARVQAEAHALRLTAAEQARAAAEAAASHALEAEVARVRAEAETRLKQELETIREEAVQLRRTGEFEARQAAEEARQTAEKVPRGRDPGRTGNRGSREPHARNRAPARARRSGCAPRSRARPGACGCRQAAAQRARRHPPAGRADAPGGQLTRPGRRRGESAVRPAAVADVRAATGLRSASDARPRRGA